jgi:hypothetical protein
LSTFFDFLILIVVSGCSYLVYKLNSSLKGGELASAWFWILISLWILGLALLLEVGGGIGLFTISPALVSFIKLIWIGVFGMGLFQIRKALS